MRSGTDGPVCGGHWVADPFRSSFQAALADLVKWLEAARIPAMVIGRVAASALGLLAAHPQVNISEARRWVREFATAMSMSDMLEEFDRLVAQRSPEP